MDPLTLESTRLEFLGDQAARADARIAALAQEGLLHRGGLQHLGNLQTLVEGHRDRLQAAAPPPADAGQPSPTEQPEPQQEATRLRHTISGVHDALTYLRAQTRAADLSAKQAEASLAEMQRHREDLGAQGRVVSGRVAALHKELAAGTPQAELGRPPPAAQVRADLNQRLRQAADQLAPEPPPARARGRARPAT